MVGQSRGSPKSILCQIPYQLRIRQILSVWLTSNDSFSLVDQCLQKGYNKEVIEIKNISILAGMKSVPHVKVYSFHPVGNYSKLRFPEAKQHVKQAAGRHANNSRSIY